MNKLQKSLKVVKDLKTLEFKVSDYTADHPEGKYSVWLANGFWFVALYQVDGKWVDHSISKFGAIGKILVWWELRKVVHKYKQKRRQIKREKANSMLRKIWCEK